MSALTEFFLNSNASITPLETMVISHPSFSKTYYIVRNAIGGITATLEDATTHTFTYYPLSIKRNGATDDLDQKLDIQLGDLGETVPAEIDNIVSAGTSAIKPKLVFRTFRSDDLTAPMDGPFTYEISAIGTKDSHSAFTASAPSLNTNRTGEIYDLDRFPMLIGFL